MVERICPECRAGNELDAHNCASCGATLVEALARRPGGILQRNAGALPARWQQAGKAVALGAVALAVEAGAAWLQHRAAQKPAPLAQRPSSPTTHRRGYVARQRVWETYENGSLSRRVVEQTLWSLPEDDAARR